MENENHGIRILKTTEIYDIQGGSRIWFWVLEFVVDNWEDLKKGARDGASAAAKYMEQ